MNAVPLDQIISMWEKDSNVDSTEPSKEILKIPTLHSKYAKILSAHSLSSKQCHIEFARMKKLKYEYYNGKLDADELKKLGWEPFRFLLKSDINLYLDADADLVKITAKIALHEEAMSFCSSVLKELNSRTYQLRAFMDWEKFIQGVG